MGYDNREPYHYVIRSGEIYKLVKKGFTILFGAGAEIGYGMPSGFAFATDICSP
jgi:hypothetical protein